MKKKTKELIGYWGGRMEYLKPQYRQFQDCKNTSLVAVHIYLTNQNKYGFVVELHDWHESCESIWRPTNRKQKKKIKNITKKFKDDNKPVDTSKWVKPDETSIRRALIEEFVLCELLDEKSSVFHDARVRAGVLYSILHSHSPKNPQNLTNFATDSRYIEKILYELKHPEAGTTYRLMNIDTDKGKKFDWWKWIKQSHEWEEKVKRTTIKLVYKSPSKKYIEMMRKSHEKYDKPTPEKIKEIEETLKKCNTFNKEEEERIKRIEFIKETARVKYGVKPWKLKNDGEKI